MIRFFIFAVGFLIFLTACHPRTSIKPSTFNFTSVDSLKITVTAINLSEDITDNDELLIFCYRYNDTLNLNAPIVQHRLTFHSKNSVRQFKVKVTENIIQNDLLLFLLEQDADWKARKLDSTLRVSHIPIRKEFAKRNYTGLEKYLGDEDVLGIKLISQWTGVEPYLVNFSGIYKLDKFEYTILIESLK